MQTIPVPAELVGHTSLTVGPLTPSGHIICHLSYPRSHPRLSSASFVYSIDDESAVAIIPPPHLLPGEKISIRLEYIFDSLVAFATVRGANVDYAMIFDIVNDVFSTYPIPTSGPKADSVLCHLDQAGDLLVVTDRMKPFDHSQPLRVVDYKCFRRSGNVLIEDPATSDLLHYEQAHFSAPYFGGSQGVGRVWSTNALYYHINANYHPHETSTRTYLLKFPQSAWKKLEWNQDGFILQSFIGPEDFSFASGRSSLHPDRIAGAFIRRNGQDKRILISEDKTLDTFVRLVPDGTAIIQLRDNSNFSRPAVFHQSSSGKLTELTNILVSHRPQKGSLSYLGVDMNIRNDAVCFVEYLDENRQPISQCFLARELLSGSPTFVDLI